MVQSCYLLWMNFLDEGARNAYLSSNSRCRNDYINILSSKKVFVNISTHCNDAMSSAILKLPVFEPGFPFGLLSWILYWTQWALAFVRFSFFFFIFFLTTCSRLSWSHSAFEPTLNSNVISYCIVFGVPVYINQLHIHGNRGVVWYTNQLLLGDEKRAYSLSQVSKRKRMCETYGWWLRFLYDLSTYWKWQNQRQDFCLVTPCR